MLLIATLVMVPGKKIGREAEGCRAGPLRVHAAGRRAGAVGRY